MCQAIGPRLTAYGKRSELHPRAVRTCVDKATPSMLAGGRHREVLTKSFQTRRLKAQR